MDTSGDTSLWRGPAGRLFVLLCALNLLNYIDRAAVSGLIDPIRRDLGATDAQMGLVGSAFLLTYSFLPPVFGWIGDRFRRTRLLAGSAAAWCLATAATGLIGSVGQLAGARAVVGLGEAAYMANTPSLLSDVYPERRRGMVLSIFYAAAPIGAALGVAISGWIAGHLGWRAACYLVGLPGLVAAALLFRSREPVRGAMEGVVAPPPPPFLKTVRMLAGRRPFVVLLLALAGNVFVQNAVEYWLPTILQRDQGMPIAEANGKYALMVFIAGVVGPLIGAWAGDFFKKRYAGAYYYVAATGILLTILPFAAIAVSSNPTVVFGSVLVESLVANGAVGLVFAIAISQVGAEMRGTTAAVLLTSIHLLGDTFSIPLVGSVSTALTNGHLPALAALATSLGANAGRTLTIALTFVSIPMTLLAAGFFLWSSRLSLTSKPAMESV